MSCSIFDQADLISPLTLDRANRGCPLTSTSPIFQLPIELLGSIIQYLNHADLASLALVDRDCRQLARSIQFSTLKLDYYRGTTSSLLAKLETEQESGSQEPTIGACVRRLIVTDMPDLPNQEFIRDLAQQPLDPLHQSKKNAYISALCAVIAGALPNLLAIDWNVSVTLSPYFLRSIAVSPVKHLRLCDVSLGRAYIAWEVPLDMALRDPKWALETLDVTAVGKVFHRDSALLDIIRQASPTLRALALRSNIISWKIPLTVGEKVPIFPSLHVLLLASIGVDGDALAILIGKSTQLRAMFVDSTGAGISYNMRLTGKVHTLERFYWIRHHADNYSDVLAFIDANPQLRSFETASPLPPLFVCDRLLPRLSRFQDLTSLSLIWEGKNIPGDALHLLGFIATLRNVWLSAGDQTTHHDWVIDHTAIRDSLAPLHHLKSLAFSQDTYSMWWTRESSQRYYTIKEVPLENYFAYLDIEEIDQIEMMNEVANDCGVEGDESAAQGFLQQIRDIEDVAWERYHQQCMVGLGTWYAEYFSALEWCYIGQLSMVIRDHRGSREADLDITERDIALKVLKKKWEGKIAEC
jgi:hypothetical protein